MDSFLGTSDFHFYIPYLSLRKKRGVEMSVYKSHTSKGRYECNVGRRVCIFFCLQVGIYNINDTGDSLGDGYE
jgi:hypothetical protein